MKLKSLIILLYIFFLHKENQYRNLVKKISLSGIEITQFLNFLFHFLAKSRQ